MRQAEFDVMTLIATRDTAALDRIVADADRAKPDAMLARSGERMSDTRYTQMRDGGVAVIDLNGRISKRMNLFAQICGGGTSTEMLLKDFQYCLDSPNVKSIVFNIDSPGGEAFGVNEIAQHIYAARGRKPIKAYVSGLGCSGAYWIATACDEIITDKSAFLGSIGVVSVMIDDTEAYKMMGYDKKVVTSSNAPKKRLDLNTVEGMAEFQAELDAMESVFIGAVARNMKKKREDVVRDFNQGGVLVGNDAVKAGMAHRTGSLEQLVRELARNNKPRAGSVGAETSEGEMDMNFKEKVKELAVSLGFSVAETEIAPEVVAEESEAAPEASTPAPEPAPEAPSADLAAERAKIDAERNEMFASKAKNFVAAEVAASRLLPAEAASFEASYLQALKDDHAHPIAGYSRVSGLETAQASRQPHHFQKETIAPDATYQVLSGDASPDAVSAERKQELMGKTPLGKSALKLVNK